MLTGTYELHSEVSGRLLRALPGSLVLREDEWDGPVIPLLADEIVKDEPGQEAVLERLLDLLLRAWFARPEAGVSRAALARRCHALVGEPPMTFRTGWRCGVQARARGEPGAVSGGGRSSRQLRLGRGRRGRRGRFLRSILS